MEIIISGGTAREREYIRSIKDGMLEGYKYLAIILGEMFDKTPTQVLINPDSTRILNAYLLHHSNRKLTSEVALAEVFSLGGRIDFINSSGYIISCLSILPLGDVPLQQSSKNATLYNMWWKDYRWVQGMLLDNHPSEFTALRYTANDSSIIIKFKSLDDKRGG